MKKKKEKCKRRATDTKETDRDGMSEAETENELQSETTERATAQPDELFRCSTKRIDNRTINILAINIVAIKCHNILYAFEFVRTHVLFSRHSPCTLQCVSECLCFFLSFHSYSVSSVSLSLRSVCFLYRSKQSLAVRNYRVHKTAHTPRMNNDTARITTHNRRRTHRKDSSISLAQFICCLIILKISKMTHATHIMDLFVFFALSACLLSSFANNVKKNANTHGE